MAKDVKYNDDARRLLKSGIDKVANVVKLTLGPRGRNVAIQRSWGGPSITNDGVSIAKEITLENKFENMGAELVKEVANKTNEKAGDGTTTSVVLFQAMVEDGLKRISFGANPMSVKAGIVAATHDAEDALAKMAIKINSKAQIKQVATISAESEELGSKIADIVEKVGKDGVVTVEESQSIGIESDFVEGMEFDKGYVSAYLITNTDRMEAEAKDAPILITDKKISAIKDILPLLEKLAQAGKRELVIIADDVDGEALATFIVNKLKGVFSVLAVKAPGYGDRKKEMLADIAATVGAQVISEDIGLKLENVDVSMLGRATRVVATKDSTVIVGGKGLKRDIDARVSQIKAQLENTDSKFDKEKYQERIAKLTGGVAVIRVGAATETEMKYLKDKIEDAVNATKAAIAEGVVPGGGSALARVSKKLNDNLSAMANSNPAPGAEFVAGYAIVINACLTPLMEIIRNATHDVGVDSKIHLTRVMKAEFLLPNGKIEHPENLGYNAVTGELVKDMFEEGIIDPVKVTRMALVNAASAAGIVLTTDALIADIPEEKKESAGGMPGGMGME